MGAASHHDRGVIGIVIFQNLVCEVCALDAIDRGMKAGCQQNLAMHGHIGIVRQSDVAMTSACRD